MKKSYTFPAIFSYAPDGISIKFPDLPGCLSCADDTDEAVSMAADALGMRLYSDECDDSPIPEPSDILTLKGNLEPNQIAVPIRVYMPLIRDIYGRQKSANKMCTLPEWLLNAGKEAGINFSQTLQDALMEKLGTKQVISRRKR